MSLPPRRYDLVGDILATAVTRSSAGEPMGDVLRDVAYKEGFELGVQGREGNDAGGERTFLHVLETQGYEPHLDDGVVTLTNCPFDSLAQKHTDVVCGLNVDFVQGIADGVGCCRVDARLEPQPGCCCVKANLAPPTPAAG